MYREIFEPVSAILEIGGVLAIAAAVVFAIIKFPGQLQSEGGLKAYDGFRARLGRGILLGLELLVGADIISTVTSQMTWESVGLLGMIVLIRTFLSFSLEVEIDGVLPWRRRAVAQDAD